MARGRGNYWGRSHGKRGKRSWANGVKMRGNNGTRTRRRDAATCGCKGSEKSGAGVCGGGERGGGVPTERQRVAPFCQHWIPTVAER